MPDFNSKLIIDDAVAKAMQLDLCFLTSPGQRCHVPFTFTPMPINTGTLTQLETVSLLLGHLTHALSLRGEILQTAHQPLAAGDPFFAALLACHRELLSKPDELYRIPLLLQRSDFMLDESLGARLIECNSIAAGMAPFGEQVQKLHRYLKLRWPDVYRQYSGEGSTEPLNNPATHAIAIAIAKTAQHVAMELGDNSSPAFLMVVQENEDNVFDQQLLEYQLQELGVRTYRRTFRQLHQQLSTGPNHALQLEGCGTVHVVYLRAGYQYKDYIATDLDTRRCCDALQNTRIFIERHKVAVNATVAQQLATSKRMQLYVTNGGNEVLEDLGFGADDRTAITSVLAEMRRVDTVSIERLKQENDSANWVLKNQGEGGGHCFFDDDILHQLDLLEQSQYNAWTLMQRLRPIARPRPTLAIRDGQAQLIPGLVSEIGLFTAHLNGEALHTGHTRSGHIGYLVRSKPQHVNEGGVHSGFGMLDSLCLVP